jgi:hypothetical protein
VQGIDHLAELGPDGGGLLGRAGGLPLGAGGKARVGFRQMVDLGPESHDQAGDEVTLWGNGLPAEEVARHIGTIAYELVIKITNRVERQFL